MVAQPKHKIISGGSYDKTAHGGHGKGQKILGPTAGPDRSGSTPHSSGAVARDGVEGRGGPKRGYQADAHSGLHHGRGGEAVGSKNDFGLMNYDHQLYGEGSSMPHVGIKTSGKHGAVMPRAEHHPAPTGQPHRFREGSVNAAHGYGHGPSQRSGVLRYSGHVRGHQVGKR